MGTKIGLEGKTSIHQSISFLSLLILPQGGGPTMFSLTR